METEVIGVLFPYTTFARIGENCYHSNMEMYRQFDLVPLKYGYCIDCVEVFNATYPDLPDKVSRRRAAREMTPEQVRQHNQKCYEVYLRARENYHNGNDSVDRWKYISICQTKDKALIAGAASLLRGAQRAQAAMLAWEEAINRLILSKEERSRMKAAEKERRKKMRAGLRAGFSQAAESML